MRGSWKVGRWLTGFLVVIGAAGCETAAPDVMIELLSREPGSVAVRDSAGVRIVSNSGPLWKFPAGWTVDTMPFVDLQQTTRRDVALSKVADVIVLTDRSILVFDYDNVALLHFDSTGTFLSQWTRAGTGPSELLEVVRATGAASLSQFHEDSVMLRTGAQILVFSRSGRPAYELLRMKRHRLTSGPAVDVPNLVRHRLPGGVFVMKDPDWKPAMPLPIERGYLQKFVLANDSAEYQRDVAQFAIADKAPGTVLEPYATRPLGLRPTLRFRDSIMVHADMASAQLLVYSVFGDLRMIVRAERPIRSLGNRTLSAFRQHFLSESEITRSADAAVAARQLSPSGRADRIERMQKSDLSWVFPGTEPLFDNLIVDDVGNLWVNEFVLPHQPRRNLWTVFDSTGRELGIVEMPKGLQVRQIGRDFVLCRGFTDDGLDRVLLFRLRKQP